MPQRIISNSFVGGEVSPELYGRHDLKVYFNGAASLENFIVRRTGGIRKRAGTEVLFTLDSQASPDDSTLDNKFKFFPYFYNHQSWGLLVLRLTDDDNPVLQSKLIIREGATSYVGTWAAVPISTSITATAHLEDLKAKQVGDTLFFTRLGYQAFTCRITMAERATEFTLMDNFITVPTPDRIRATPANFYEPQTGDASTGIPGVQNITKYYALYGVKDGVLSKPSLAQCTGRTPWSAGATITVRGTLDFTVHDYYILAKKVGMNYGKLSEIYPQEMADAAESTFVSGTLAFRDTTTGGAFCDTGAKFLNGDPDLKASSKPKLDVSPKCFGMQSALNGAEYRVVTPHFLVDFGAASNKYASVSCRNILARLDTVASASVKLALASCKFYPFSYAADGSGTITIGAAITKVANSNGVFAAINISAHAASLTGQHRFGLIIESNNAATRAAMADCLFSAGLVVYKSATSYCESDGAITAVPAGTPVAGDPNAATIACTPTVYGKVNSVIYTTMWNAHEPEDLFCNPDTATTNADWTKAAAGTTAQMDLALANDFHVFGSLVTDIYFSVEEAQKTLSTLSLFTGNTAIKWTDGTPLAMPASSTITATLKAVHPDASEDEIGVYNLDAGTIGTVKIDIEYPTGIEAQLKYRLTFSSAMRMRGISASCISAVLLFVDDNILPGDITGQQTMLKVGDTNMDCAVFDVFEQRAMYAASEDLPFSMWFSTVGDLYNYYAYRPQADDDAFTVTIPAKKASKILHSIAEKEIMLFTEDGVHIVDAEGGNGFSYRTIRMRKICNATASTSCAPIQIDGKTIFVGEDGRTVYELKYDIMSDAIMPNDKSVMAYHLTETAQIVKIAYQRFPDSVIWFLLDDGSLIAMTYMPDHEVFAWSHHPIPATAHNLKIIDIMDIGSLVTGDDIETTSDIVLILEEQDIGGLPNGKTLVERMRPNICADVLTLGDDNNECTDHLNGDHPTDITATLETLRPESPEVNTQGVPKRVVDVCLRIRRSGQLSVAPDIAGMTAMTGAGATADAVAGTLTLYNGDVDIMPLGHINKDGQLLIKSSDAKPCEILSAVYTLELP